MKFIVYCVLFIFSHLNTTAQSYNEKVTTVDILMHDLSQQTWTEDEQPCYEQTIALLQNVKNYTVWAMCIWNSMQPPVGIFSGSRYSMGHYDQCMNSPSVNINPQYCLSRVKLPNRGGKEADILELTDAYVNTITKEGRMRNILYWGSCWPDSCKPVSVEKILKSLYSVNPITGSEPEIQVETCERAGAEKIYSFGYYCFMTLIFGLVTTSVCATIYVSYANSNLTSTKRAEAFCLRRNFRKLVEPAEDQVVLFNAVKGSVACAAVIIHLMYLKVGSSLSNGSYFDKFYMSMETYYDIIKKHNDKVIDIFLTISGCLLVTKLMKKRQTAIAFLVTRYFRLIGIYALVIFYITSVLIHTGDGPIWSKFIGKEQNACDENWLISLLMLGNYVHCENICHIVSWNIPCDYQLAIMGTVLFTICQKYKRTGKIVTIFFGVLSMAIPGVLTYWYRLPGTLSYYGNIDELLNLRTNRVLLNIYIKSYNRAGPYLVGMGLGYIMSVYDPKKFRNSISKKYSIALLLAAVSLTLLVITSVAPIDFRNYNALGSAIFAAFGRTLIGVVFCIVAGVAEYGSWLSAAVRDIASLRVFTILNRLVYGLFLTHLVIGMQLIYSRRNLQQFDSFIMESIENCGIVVLSVIVSAVLWLFVEAPINNITNAISRPKLNAIDNTFADTNNNKIK